MCICDMGFKRFYDVCYLNDAMKQHINSGKYTTYTTFCGRVCRVFTSSNLGRKKKKNVNINLPRWEIETIFFQQTIKYDLT